MTRVDYDHNGKPNCVGKREDCERSDIRPDDEPQRRR
jgi:hypothetical protein